MNSAPTLPLQAMRAFMESGQTLSYEFRKNSLRNLKAALLKNQVALQEALYKDLGKNPEESWVTETGFLLSEINHTLKHLRKWMKPERKGTNLVNFGSKSFIYREPLGVVLIIGPWNYPLQLLLTPLVGAIAAGNCAVLKPSEFSPATTAVMKTIISEAFPENQVIIVEGEGAEIVPTLIGQFRFDHIFYTGSTIVGRKIYEMAASKLIPVTLELGGKSPCVVLADANIKIAARRIALPKFSNAGQMCVAPDYVLVHKSVKNALIDALKTNITSFYGKDPEHSYEYGKIINGKQFHRLINLLEKGTILYGGRHDETNLFIEPTLIDGISPDDNIMKEEIFGPILPIIEFGEEAEAMAIIKMNADPLAFYLFTESSSSQNRWISQLPFGGGCINNASWHLTNFNLPFGGRGNSGIGAYHGKYSFDTFSHAKSIMRTPTWLDPSIKYPPFKGRLSLFKKLIR